MRRRTSIYRRRRHTGVLALLLFLTTLLLVSCVAGSNVLWVRGLLGLDIGDYAAEPTEQALPVNGKTAEMLTEHITFLLDGSVHLTPFAGTDEAVKFYRDKILNAMLRSNYAHYNGNAELLARVGEVDPQLRAFTLIPAVDFENTVFRYFGGTTVEHQNGKVFSYLSRADLYTTGIQARECGVAIEITSLEETANTYRMHFSLTDGDTRADYQAIFVKRNDGSAYFKVLQ